MKILILSNCALKESQGSGYVILNFCRGLRARSHEVDLFGPEQFEPLPAWRRAKRYRQALGMLFWAVGRSLRKKYDIIEFYGAESCLAVSALSAWRGRSSLLVSHSNGFETFDHEQMTRFLGSASPEGARGPWVRSGRVLPLENAFTKVDGIVTVSESERQYALEHCYQRPDRVVAIDNPLPDDYLGQEVELARGPTVGFCGSWLPRKGIQLIESAVPRLLADFPDLTFTLIGVGDRFRTGDHFPASVLSRVRVVPFVDTRDELRGWYRSFAVLIVPSIHESFGLVTAEGMACGCAVVTTRTGFGNDLKDREEAVLLERATPECLYAAVQELIANEALRRQVALGGYHRVQDLRWSSAVARLENCYQTWSAAHARVAVRGSRAASGCRRP